MLGLTLAKAEILKTLPLDGVIFVLMFTYLLRGRLLS